ncbi:MAG: hypothetical protein CL577_09275 [Alteromonadaceae bacterium]|uniref:Uncharacterized protein n=1 Tax=Rheinheimera aquimaris TaxID=412437 RepID=A0ABN1E724_9GAMM|nr:MULTISPECIES: hypothetical protein [Rheinheimera]MBJ92769.1 hypothetical protein [Alteromonadaceae bacterium]MCB5214320.1 hypothetical protein [Rheinheimera aquimaris]MCD1600219.1 hypothetical protein [Rheinheimera aquimaris]
MAPKFWKLSQGTDFFSYQDMADTIENKLVYVHSDTPAKGKSHEAQGANFIGADIGDYFYLTHGNKGIYLLGQLIGPANIFSLKGDGWVDRPFRLIRLAAPNGGYLGPQKWWAPNDRSTFTAVPEKELTEFETNILTPFFDITFDKFGINV